MQAMQGGDGDDVKLRIQCREDFRGHPEWDDRCVRDKYGYDPLLALVVWMKQMQYW